MLKQFAKLALLVALVTTLVITSAPAFAGSCHWDNKISQCVNNGCAICISLVPGHCGCGKRPF